MISNNAPVFRWKRAICGNGDVQATLWVNGAETPFFALTARYRDGYTFGHRHGLWGAGLCPKSGIALPLAGLDRISEIKARAERLWCEWSESGELEQRIEAGKAGRRAFFLRWGRGEGA